MWKTLKSTASVKTTLLIILAIAWCEVHQWLQNYLENHYLTQVAPNQLSDNTALKAFKYQGMIVNANNHIFLLGLLIILILVIGIYRKQRKMRLAQ
jgi:hypothetical protein